MRNYVDRFHLFPRFLNDGLLTSLWDVFFRAGAPFWVIGSVSHPHLWRIKVLHDVLLPVRAEYWLRRSRVYHWPHRRDRHRARNFLRKWATVHANLARSRSWNVVIWIRNRFPSVVSTVLRSAGGTRSNGWYREQALHCGSPCHVSFAAHLKKDSLKKHEAKENSCLSIFFFGKITLF